MPATDRAPASRQLPVAGHLRRTADLAVGAARAEVVDHWELAGHGVLDE